MIPPNDLDALERAHSRLKPSKLRWLLHHDIDLGNHSVSIGPVQIGDLNPQRVWRRATLRSRMYEAAREWTRPGDHGHADALPLKSLSALRRSVGLEHWHEHDFARDLQGACSELVRSVPELRRWIDCRNALLDYLLSPAQTLPPELQRTLLIFERSVQGVTHLGAVGEREGAVLVATELMQKALDGAKSACCWVISQQPGAQRTDCSANLMLPVEAGYTPRDPGQRNNFDACCSLWDGIRHTKRLMVLAETEPGVTGQSHSGFWLPIIRTDRGHCLPGAGDAFVLQRPRSVFKDDLPSLAKRGLPDSTDANWRAHMTSRFERKLFISIPIVVPTERGVTQVAAVLNVNVSPPEEDKSWLRAYHEPWLTAAAAAVEPFGRHAFWSTLHLLANGGGKCQLTDLPDTKGFLPGDVEE